MSYSDNHVCSQQFFLFFFFCWLGLSHSILYLLSLVFFLSIFSTHTKKTMQKKVRKTKNETPFALSNSWLSVLGNISTSFFNHFVLFCFFVFFFVSCFVFTLFGNVKLRCANFVYGSEDKSSLRHIFSIYGHYINRFLSCPLFWPVFIAPSK